MSRKDKFKRQCIVCREFKDKSELMRFTKNFKTGEIELNEDNEFLGRSVYICENSECLKMALKKQFIQKKLKADFSEKIKETLSVEM